ncbi:MAG TPA: ABC transporter permease [Thermoanaerobaculia bacterium]|jgi:putative ABC transport system permease protein
MELLWKDIRYAFHSLRTNPGFALVAILTLALGIGATTAIFSVVNGVLLRPLPMHEPDRVVYIGELEKGGENRYTYTSPANYNEWAKQTKLFASSGATFDWEANLTGHGEPALIRAGLASAGLFETLGAKPYLGRVITRADIEGGPADQIVLSHSFWKSKFGGDRKVIGKRVQLEGDSVVIIGVMPPDFFVPNSRAHLWVAYNVPTAEGQNRGRYLQVLARLAPGVTIEQADAALKVVHTRLAQEFPRWNRDMYSELKPVHEHVVGNVRRALLIVMAAVGVLLLIACVNIANLLLSRATSRTKEMAVRSALGASRGQLVRQLLTESVVLAVIAGIVGIVIAGWATMVLVRFTPESAMVPRTNEIAIDGTVLAIAAVLTLATGVLFGLAPALEGTRTDLQTGLKSSSRGASSDRRGRMFRDVLVVAEVALATVLLIGAGLLMKSFARLEAVSSGVERDNVLTMRVVLPDPNQTPEQRVVRLNTILDQIRKLPGVKNVGAIISLHMPFTGSLSRDTVRVEGQPVVEGHEQPSDIRAIAGEHFQSLGMRLKTGRMLDYRATSPERTEVVINEAMARDLFNDKNPIGRRLVFEWFQPIKAEIVGVVSDIRAEGLDMPAAPAIYFNHYWDPNQQFTLSIASTVEPLSLVPAVSGIIRKADARIPISDVKTLEELVSGTIARPRFNATMVALFAALGLLLASVGIYGVLSYSVTQRTHEMGIRMALGAEPRDVLRLVVRDGLKVAVLGVLVGIGIALPATRVLASLLYGVEASDPIVFAAVALALTVIALLASYLPARRATQVHPMIALRPE